MENYLSDQTVTLSIEQLFIKIENGASTKSRLLITMPYNIGVAWHGLGCRHIVKTLKCETIRKQEFIGGNV